jgi:hypothetical protein
MGTLTVIIFRSAGNMIQCRTVSFLPEAGVPDVTSVYPRVSRLAAWSEN